MGFVRILEQRGIISPYNINRPVFIRHGMCLLRGTNWAFKCKSG